MLATFAGCGHVLPPHVAETPPRLGTPDALMLTLTVTRTGTPPALSAFLIAPDAVVTWLEILEMSEPEPGTRFPSHCPLVAGGISSHSQLELQRSPEPHELPGADESQSSPVSTAPFPQTGGGRLTGVGCLLLCWTHWQFPAHLVSPLHALLPAALPVSHCSPWFLSTVPLPQWSGTQS